MSVDIKTVIQFIYEISRYILTLEIFFINLKSLHSSKWTSFLNFYRFPILLFIICFLRIKGLLQPHFKKTTSLLRTMARVNIGQTSIDNSLLVCPIRNIIRIFTLCGNVVIRNCGYIPFDFSFAGVSCSIDVISTLEIGKNLFGK